MMASKKATRRAIPYERIQQLADQGLGAMEIGKRTNRLIKGDDPTHSIRAILSLMRSKGWRDKDGKLHKLTVKRVGKIAKAAKKAKTSVEKKHRSPKKARVHKHHTPKPIAAKLDGKMLAAGEGKQ